mmetsp:Transcript_11700/g.37158  ORF Transcript_11700/g.37158 Transcript_11700/m.37158 type:complete len:244 (-) Transcript_11700:137-868(-)
MSPEAGEDDPGDIRDIPMEGPMPRASQVVPLNLEAQAGDNTRPPPPPPPLEATPLAWEPSESSLDFLTGSEALGGRSLPAGASEFSPRVASLRYSISDVAGAKLRAKKKKQNTRKKSSKTPLSPGASKERPSSRVGPLMKGETELGIALALHDVAEHGDVERLLDLMDNGWRHESRGVRGVPLNPTPYDLRAESKKAHRRVREIIRPKPWVKSSSSTAREIPRPPRTAHKISLHECFHRAVST